MPTNALEVIFWDASGISVLDQIIPLPGGSGGGNGKTPPAWPSYTGVSQLVGTNGAVTVWVDPSLGPEALQNASDLLNDADRIFQANDRIFASQGGPVDVIVFALGGATDGTGGADHMGCDFETGAAIEVCASFGNSMRCSALFEAELSECSMNGQLCGLSTGEALSRWCAIVLGNNALSDFASAPTWDQDGRPNFVDVTDQTDQNYDSIGCGMSFLSWLMSLGSTLSQVAVAMVNLGKSGTLAGLYAALTGNDKAQAWSQFNAALSGNSITDDDPFGALASQLSVRSHLKLGSRRLQKL